MRTNLCVDLVVVFERSAFSQASFVERVIAERRNRVRIRRAIGKPISTGVAVAVGVTVGVGASASSGESTA